jgi:hypothetical protein
VGERQSGDIGGCNANRTCRHAGGTGALRRFRDLRGAGRPAPGQGRARSRRVLPHGGGRQHGGGASGQPRGHGARPPAGPAQEVAGDAQPHGAVHAAPHAAPAGRRDRVQRRQLRLPAGVPRPPDPSGHPRRRARVEAHQVAGGGAPLLPDGRAARRALVRRADRRCTGHLRLLRRRVQRPDRADCVRCTDPGRRVGSAGGAGAVPPRLPPRGRPVRAGEPRRPHRRGVPAQRREAPARSRRLRAVRRRAPTRSPTTGSASSAASGTRTCSTSSTPIARPTCTATRSAVRTRRCSGRSGPGRRRSRST